MPEPIPRYAGPAMQMRESAFELADCLRGDVQVDHPDVLLALIRATAIAVGNSVSELADAADAAGQGPAAAALRRALSSQLESAQALAEAVQALTSPRVLRG
ncbi:hypothetical protein ABZ671_18690 [Micromonospora sp. NPDC006766]|uniref:hypothetical protein n=1 Tax=Micromonospora sp. NPDC006766 TaxID=3154778 RepID=UPI0033D9790D